MEDNHCGNDQFGAYYHHVYVNTLDITYVFQVLNNIPTLQHRSLNKLNNNNNNELNNNSK